MRRGRPSVGFRIRGWTASETKTRQSSPGWNTAGGLQNALWQDGKKATQKTLANAFYPDLKSWEELTAKVGQYDVDAVKLIPQLLALDKKVIYGSKKG
jgi:hypothetical protein